MTGAAASQAYLDAVNMPPPVPARPRVYVMTEELVLKQTKQPDLRAVTYLNLHGNSLRRLEGMLSSGASVQAFGNSTGSSISAGHREPRSVARAQSRAHPGAPDVSASRARLPCPALP